MKCFAMTFAVALAALLTNAHAVEPKSKSEAPGLPLSVGTIAPTPEMWFYEQAQRQYHDPKAAVRQKSEYSAAQRQQRLAAQTWYGMSRARPTANPTVHAGGVYAPQYGLPGRIAAPTQINVVMFPTRPVSTW